MRRLNPSIAASLGLAVSVACNSSPLGPTPLPQDCRTFATAWTTTSTFGQPASYSASFNSDTHTYVVTSPAGSSQPVRRVVYASTADFIDEPGAFARVLSTRTESCPEDAPCGGPTAGTRAQLGICTAPIAFTYDESTRTMTLAPSGPGLGLLCIGLMFGTTRVYDANGDVISESGTGGGTTTTTTRTVGATTRVCK